VDPRALVPHREPFLLLDRVLSADATRAVAEALVPAAGLSATLLLECLAQTCACVGTLARARAGAAPRGLLVSVRDFRAARPIGPGEKLHLEAERVGGMGEAALFQARAHVGDEPVASAQLGFVLVID